MDLYNMELNDILDIRSGRYIRTTGGWIFESLAQGSCCFIPYNTEFKPKVKVKPKKRFTPPTLKEALDYFKFKGYKEDVAKTAWEYYHTANWKDARGNQVKNWKQKMLSVWMKPENKLPISVTETQEDVDKEVYDALL